MLREAVPELVSLIPHNMHIVVVAAYHDTSCEISHELARGIAGSYCIDREWPKGPAYRTLPDLFTQPINQLTTELVEPVIAPSDGDPPVECVECCAGSAHWTANMTRLGFIGRAY